MVLYSRHYNVFANNAGNRIIPYCSSAALGSTAIDDTDCSHLLGQCGPVNMSHPPAPINSRPISIRRISLVPAPMSSSLASRQ